MVNTVHSYLLFSVQFSLAVTAEQMITEIKAARVSKNPLVDDELKDILLEYAIDQVKKGKIKIVEDND